MARYVEDDGWLTTFFELMGTQREPGSISMSINKRALIDEGTPAQHNTSSPLGVERGSLGPPVAGDVVVT